MITKEILNKIRSQIDPLLDGLNKDNQQFNLRLGNCTYNPDTATFKLEVRSVTMSGEIVTKESSDLRAYVMAGISGMREEHLTKEFWTARGKSKLVGLKSRANKCWVFEVIEGQNKGKQYVCDTINIKRYMGEK